MTSNTYDKVKEKENTLAETAVKRGRAKASQNTDALIGRSAENTTVKGEDTSIKNGVTKTGSRSASKRREKAHTKPQAIHTRIPAILGFDTREKFTTIAATTVNKYPLTLTVAIILVLTSMFMMVIINAVNINKIKLETTQMSSTLEELIEKEAELSLELEKRDDLRYIREVALNQYGMIDKKLVTKYYISLDKDPKVELIDKADSEPVVDGTAD